MTYNFDPDRWLEDRQRLVEMRRQAGELDERACREALEELERRYEEMVARLQGTYELPPPRLS